MDQRRNDQDLSTAVEEQWCWTGEALLKSVLGNWEDEVEMCEEMR